MKALEQKLDALQKGDILVLAGSIPASLALSLIHIASALSSWVRCWPR